MALAIRTTELCQTGASQSEWAKTRVTFPGFELMVATRLLPLIVALLEFLALASRTTELCQTGPSQPKWARTRVTFPGFELMVATKLCSGA